MSTDLIASKSIRAAILTVCTPISYFPFRFFFILYWAFQDPPGSAIKRDAIAQFVYNFTWSFKATVFDLWIYAIIAISVFYISIPVLFLLNLLGELAISKIHIKWHLHFALNWLIAAGAYALFWYFAFYGRMNPIYAF